MRADLVFSGTSGAGFASAQPTSLSASTDSVTWSIAGRGCSIAFSSRRASFSGVVAISPMPRATRSAWEGSGSGDPLVVGLGGLGDRRDVEQHGREVDPRDAVDQGVVCLREQCEAPSLQTLDEPHLPKRLRAVELLREQAPSEALELVLGAGLGSAEWRT